MRKIIIVIGLIIGILTPSMLIAVERAPRISDREIVERLTRLEEGQRNIETRFDDVNRRFDDINRRIDDLRSEMNRRFDTIQWMFGLFITITLVILGFVLRMQWQMHRRQTQVETTLKMQKDDFAFLKDLIEKLLPPKGIL
jgi:uncharacterized membrane-anchored protein YhcB (DUF1043 family)